MAADAATHTHLIFIRTPAAMALPTAVSAAAAVRPRPFAAGPLSVASPSPCLFSRRRSPNFVPSFAKPLLRPVVANAAGDGGPSSSAGGSGGGGETVVVKQDQLPLEGVIQFEKPGGASSKLMSWAHVAFLAGGDVFFLLLFSAIGRYSHGFPVFSVDTLHSADPFIAGWIFSAYFLGGYGDDGKGKNGLSSGIAAAAKSWALGIQLGIMIRAVSSGHFPQLPFVLVTMGSTGVLLIGWRALLCQFTAKGNSKSDDYRRGSPFELFELLTSLVRRW